MAQANKNKNVSVKFNEEVLNWKYVNENKIIIYTSKNVQYTTKKLIISAGAFVQKLLPDLKLPVYVERKKVFLIRPEE